MFNGLINAAKKKAGVIDTSKQLYESEEKRAASDPESSPGASDDDTEDFDIAPAFQAQSGASNSNKKSHKEQKLHDEFVAVSAKLENAIKQDDESTSTPSNSSIGGNTVTHLVGAAYSFMTRRRQPTLEQSVTNVASVIEKPATPPKSKPKTQAELDEERAQKLWAMQQEESEKARLENVRLQSEPAIAKTFRKALAEAGNISMLLGDVFSGRRFGKVVNPKNADYAARLQAETQSNTTALDSMNLFAAWKMHTLSLNVPSQMNQNFDFLGPRGEKIARLSELWNEVFQYYAIAKDEAYPFSLQALEKLRYFYEELIAFSKLQSQFDAYMKNTPVNVRDPFLAEKQVELEKFIATVNLFSARTIMLYKLLDGLKTQMERTEKMQRQLRGIPGMELPDEVVLNILDDDEKFQAVKPEWQVEVEAAEEALKTNTKELGQTISSINYLDTTEEKECAKNRIADIEAILPALQQRLSEAQMAQPQWKSKFDAIDKVFNERVNRIDAHRELIRANKENGTEIEPAKLALAQAELKILDKEYPLLLKEYQAAQLEVIRETQNDIQAQRATFDEAQARKKAEHEAEKEEAQRQLETNRILKTLSATANVEATAFLMEYAARPDSAALLTLSQPVRAPSSAVSTEMLQLWLSDQTDGLSTEEAKWLSELITLEIRELAFSLRAQDSTVEILLEDKAGNMLEVLSIHLDGSVRGSLVTSEAEFLSLRTANAYSAELNKQNENTLTALKGGPSLVSERAVALLREISSTKIEKEAHPHAQLAHMNKKTFALFGLYLLLYLQDAPPQNFADVDVYNDNGSSARPGTGSRFLRQLMKDVQRQWGYHLRNGKMIYDSMKQRAIPVKKLTNGLKANAASESPAGSRGEISGKLEYLFDSYRTAQELSSAKGTILLPGDRETLIGELTGRYLSKLESMVNEPSLPPEVDRKRMKRIVEIMEQLPYPKRQLLMNSPVIQLFILRDQVEDYRRSSTGQKQSIVSSTFAGLGRGVIKGIGADRKEDKFKFFNAVFEYLKLKVSANSEPALIQEISDTFILNFYKNITQKEEFFNVGDWVNKVVLEGGVLGTNALDTLMWLPNTVLDNIFLGAGIGAKTIREMKGMSEEAFNYTYDLNNKNVDEAIASYVPIVSANELMIVLALQAAVLSFDKLILDAKTERVIIIASEHSWFLQLRFLHVILIEKKILPVYNAQASAPMYKRERDMLNVFDNMMRHISELPVWIDTCFERARVDVREIVSGMTDAEKTKLAFVLVAEFFFVMFGALSALAYLQKDQSLGGFLAKLSAHINVINKMAGFTLNGDCESVLFSLAVNFLLENPGLLKSSRITSGAIANGARNLIKNADSSLDTYFTSTTIGVGLIEPESEAKKLETLTDKRVALFVHDRSRSLDSQEALLVNDAICRVKI